MFDYQATLPDVLKTLAGQTVQTAEEWRSLRRPEVLALLAEHVYGRTPETVARVTARLVSQEQQAGYCRREMRAQVQVGERQVEIPYRVFLPDGLARPAPAILTLSTFYSIVQAYGEDVVKQIEAKMLPLASLLNNGYAIVVAEADSAQNADGLIGYDALQWLFANETDWGEIGQWAWAASRVLDCLAQDPDIDAQRVAISGCSRAGKTALWAFAQDERFKVSLTNVSGCTGAAITRGKTGERVKEITSQFPLWMCPKYREYSEREEAMPVDQHFLIALGAPRPTYVASAEKDDWACPRMEFAGCIEANPVYRLYGEGLASFEFPAIDHPLLDGKIGYHVRTGEHGLEWFDWEQYFAFCDRWL